MMKRLEIAPALKYLEENQIIRRIWERDHTIWKPEPKEITNRLGWLDIAPRMKVEVAGLNAFCQEVKQAGCKKALLLGMGGSSLAPDMFSRTFTDIKDALQVSVLDSTDPAAVTAMAEKNPPGETLFIVSTKSGNTEETLSFFRYFYMKTCEALGKENAGAHFVAITDPGSKLSEIAAQYQFRRCFINDPNIGGRFSALSFFGLVPAALSGLDVSELLDRAISMAERCKPGNALYDNPAARLASSLAVLVKEGRDKLTFVISPVVHSFGNWVEQLIAESLGKEGKGILPVINDKFGALDVYGADRVFVHLAMAHSTVSTDVGDGLSGLGDYDHPLFHLPLKDRYDLGEQIFLWEMTVAILGVFLGVNPFDQPNVESAKVQAREMVKVYKRDGRLPQDDPVVKTPAVEVFSSPEPAVKEQIGKAKNAAQALQTFLAPVKAGDYICLQAFIQPTPATEKALDDLSNALRNRYHLAVTSGYGPRFLHSTGQLHKGDAGNGHFVQITARERQEVPIPSLNSALDGPVMTFGVLEMAQALGDRQALLDAGRRVLRIHLLEQPDAQLGELAGAIV